jgi:hypothetical protein
VTRILHVANGTSTTATIQAASLPGRSSIWADVLHDGPVPGGLSDDALLEVRARHLAATPGVSPDQATNELRRWRAAIAAGDPFDELVLWYEHDLFDQLNLIQLLSWLAALPGGAPRTTLISINTFPGHDHFKGLGELTPSELASLFGARQRVVESQFALAQTSWQAFRSSDPRSIEQLLDGDTSALPFLAAALRRHLEEFPWTADGLSRTERRLLELLATGPAGLGAIFRRMHDRETAFYIADLSFLDVAMGLAAEPPGLIAVDPATDRTLSGVASLTAQGQALRAGGVDRVRRWGIDRWRGGVHLAGAGEMWRWDSEARRLAFA